MGGEGQHVRRTGLVAPIAVEGRDLLIADQAQAQAVGRGLQGLRQFGAELGQPAADQPMPRLNAADRITEVSGGLDQALREILRGLKGQVQIRFSRHRLRFPAVGVYLARPPGR